MKIAIIDKELKRRFPNFVVQSMAAGIVVAILIVIYKSIAEYGIVIASIGASAFTIFCMPNHITAQPRRAIGGHFMGIISGVVGYFFLECVNKGTLFMGIGYGLAVFLAAFLMVSTDTEHPPAAGTAIAIAELGIEISTMFIIVAVILMSVVKKFLRNRLVDLV